MATRAAEDYLKQIWLLQQGAGGAQVPMGRLAEAIGVVPGTVTAMVKRLAGDGMVEYEPYGGVRLTRRGRGVALGVLRRHRLVETFLVEMLGLDWSEVHEEAERLEHVVSDRLLDHIDAALGYPEVDPHGDPIPSANGVIDQSAHRTLAECAEGERVQVVRVLDQDQRFLEFVDQHGLRPGAHVTVETQSPAGEALTVRPRRKARVTMGTAAAGKLLVRSERRTA